MFALPALAQSSDGSIETIAAATGFLPLLLISIPIAIGNYFLARRIDGASPALWAVLSLVPLVNFVFMYYVGYKVIFAILDHLKALRSERPSL